jgi:hypothetical protein
MISFHCWHCAKSYAEDEGRIGERFTCTCKRRLCVPGESGGDCRIPLLYRLKDAIFFGGTGAILGLLLALGMFVGVPHFAMLNYSWVIFSALTLVGLLVGLFGGEKAVKWIMDSFPLS